MLSSFFSLFKKSNEKDKPLIKAVKMISGESPQNINLYKLAVRHASKAIVNDSGFKECNERLEYLGDAVLGFIIADFLYKKYPTRDEGFLTDIRARILNRESLNVLGKKIGLSQIINADINGRITSSHRSIYGDTMEAFVAAFYLDKGFDKTVVFVIKKLLLPHFDMHELINNNPNTKSILIEWAQKQHKTIAFELIESRTNGHIKEFVIEVNVNGEALAKGYGSSKKKAEQNAAYKALETIELS